MTAPILDAQGLNYAYPGGVAALRGMNLSVQRGRRLALLGSNGCGKTTLLLHLNGTLRPGAGQVLIDGQPAGYDRASLAAWRGRVGLVLQEPDDQLFSATVYQDVSFGPLNQGLSEPDARERVREALAALDIAELAERATHLLSFGQKKRVAIAGVLAMQPQVLILDEPTAGLDAPGVTQLKAALERLQARGTTLVFSTHDVDLAYAWADDVAILGEGRLLRQGGTVATLADADLLAAAQLNTPTILTLAAALREPGRPWPGGQPPRTAEDLVACLGERHDPGRF
ncbi:ATP-binding cassette domain-containing protein [uncultured Thiodictyon sp.]|uniref:energy-coupling factor ABC transporter ATP-binding protein n=1 Tax=uncultured Thiodictyon sp. TaxID=1846217 RepID=UPI0025EF5959|nr:ATP-binding cassette domain-containing protein [uncultured Thiodictyon sp.]